jgi:hypothetical protein
MGQVRVQGVSKARGSYNSEPDLRQETAESVEEVREINAS